MKNLPSDLELLNLVEQEGSVAKAATKLGVSKRSLQKKVKKLKDSNKYTIVSGINSGGPFGEWRETPKLFIHDLNTPAGRVQWAADDSPQPELKPLQASTPPSEGNPSPEQIKALRDDLGLPEEEYELATASIKKWEAQGPEDTVKELSSIGVTFRNTKPVGMLLPAARQEEDPNLKDILTRKHNDELEKQMWIVCGDEQVPFNNKKMEEALLRFICANKFTHGISVGDLLDFPTISKYDDNPEWDGEATPQACVDEGYSLLRNRKTANPNISWSFLEGNHDARLRLEQLRRAERIYGLRPGKADGEKELEPLLTVKNLLRLDELGIEYCQAKGNYNYGSKFITDDLCVIHGDKTGPSALKNLMDEVDYSIIMGHNHKVFRMAKTKKTRTGHKVQHGINLGCLVDIDGGTGYDPRPNWQNHLAVVTVDKSDDSFSIEDVWFDGEYILFRGEKY